MATRPHARAALAVTTVLLALTAAPGTAAAAPADPALLEAVTEQVEPGPWTKKTYQVHRGEEVVAPLGVISVQKAPVRGLVAQVRAGGADVTITHRYSNCWYFTGAEPDGGTAPMAWCQFDDAVLPGGGGLSLEATMVTVRPDAAPGRVYGVGFRWQSKYWSDTRGGLRKVVDSFKVPGTPVVRGTEPKVGLTGRRLPMADIRTNGNFAPFELVDGPPPTPQPTPSASASPTPTASASASATPTPTGTGTGEGGTGGGGGLPVTGAPAGVVGGAGLALLVSGAAALVLARRRPRRS